MTATKTEYIYNGRDNRIDLLLKNDLNDGNGFVPANLSGVTKIDMDFDGTTVSSTDKAAGVITWDQPSYATGEIRCVLGASSIPAAEYPAVPIYVYDAGNPNGIRWEAVPIVVFD
jgi:hypothetical protein